MIYLRTISLTQHHAIVVNQMKPTSITFFECEYHTAIRDAFLRETIFKKHLNAHTILNGSNDISREENLKLHKAVSAFILLSNRF